jgi:hypothetical protein
LLAGVKGSVPKLSADEIEAGDSFTDPAGNSYGGAIGLLSQAGYSNGDRLYFPIASDGKSESTTSDSYSYISNSELDVLVDKSMFPGGVSIGLTMEYSASGDAIDVRIAELDSGVVIGKKKSIVGSGRISIGPFGLGSGSDIIRVVPDWKNRDDTTEISGEGFVMHLSVEL